MRPLISIVTPCFNSQNNIEKCILSVKNQKNNNIEHIIIDGGSRDSTVEIIKKYQDSYNLRWISERDSGIADAMNKGFRMAEGEYIAWIDADNYYMDNIFEYLSNKINSNPSVDIFCGYVNVVDGKINKVFKPNFPFSFKKALFRNTGGIPVQPGVFLRKSFFEKVKGFNTKYKIAGDYDFWLKVLKTNPNIDYSEEIFGYYVKEESGASQSFKGIINGLKEMLIIGSDYGQTFISKFLLVFKYFIGMMSFYKNKYF